MRLTDTPSAEMHPSHKMQDIVADIWAENNTIVFRVTLHAQSAEIAEDYLHKVYPNISTIYCYVEGADQ